MKKITALFLCLTLVLGLVLNNGTTLAATDGWVINDDGTKSYYVGGEMVVDSIMEIDGYNYYFNWEGKMAVNETYDWNNFDAETGTDSWIYLRAKEDGTLYQSEWYYSEDGYDHYYGEDCSEYHDGLFEIDGRYYYFSGRELYKRDSVVTVDDELYMYLYETGELVALIEGINAIGNSTCYIKDGQLVTGIVEIDGKSYYFNDNGIMEKNICVGFYASIDNSEVGTWRFVLTKKDGTLYQSEWYYDEDNGRPLEYYGEDFFRYEDGIYTIDGKEYAFQYGNVRTSGPGTIEDDGVIYAIVGFDGEVELVELVEGWNTMSDGSKYYIKDGELITESMYLIDSYYYSFYANGCLMTSTTFVIHDEEGNMKYYQVAADGKHYVNQWATDDYYTDKYRYYDADGAAYTDGIYEISGQKYYFDEEGYCAMNTLFQYEGKWYEADENGLFTEIADPSDGWVTVEENKFYVKDGELLKACKVSIDGKYYAFNESGVLYEDDWFWLEDWDNERFGWALAKEDGSLYQNEFYKDEYGIAYFDENGVILEEGLYTVDGKTYYSTGYQASAFGCVYYVYDEETDEDIAYRIMDDGTAQLVTFPLPAEMTEGKVNVFSWNNEISMRINTILEEYPEYKDKVVLWNLDMSGTGEEYMDFVNEQAAQDYASIFCLDTDILAYHSDKMDLELFTALSEIGITDEDYENSYAFLKQDGMIDNELKFMTWQACPNVFAYNKEIAEEVFGTSDPVAIQALIATPEDFYAAAEKVKAAGYYMTSGVDMGGTMDLMISRAQEMYTPIPGAEDFIKTLNEKGYTTGDMAWSTGWNADMISGDRVFGFFGTAWFVEWTMPEDMYMVCEGPVNYKWGGSFVGATGTGNDTEGDDVAAFILEKLCCDEEIMYKFYEEDFDFPNNKKAVANLILAGVGSTSNALNNNILSILDSAARELVKVNVEVEVEEKTPEVEIPVETETTLIESVFTEEEKELGVYLEVKLTAEAVEITDLPEKEQEAIDKVAETADKEVAVVLDLNIFKVLGATESKITDLSKPITITIDIPAEFLDGGFFFSVLRIHNNKAEMLKDLDTDPNTVTIETDGFSTYTLMYSAEEADEDDEDISIDIPTEAPSTEDDVTTSAPSEDATEEDVTTSAPSEDATEEDVTTSAPSEDVTEEDVTTSAPSEDATEDDATTEATDKEPNTGDTMNFGILGLMFLCVTGMAFAALGAKKERK